VVRALCKKKQNTAVMRTSPMAVRSVNRGADELFGVAVPASMFILIETAWPGIRKLKGLRATVKSVP